MMQMPDWDWSCAAEVCRESCICTRPQANRYERTLDYTSSQRVGETTSTRWFRGNIRWAILLTAGERGKRFNRSHSWYLI